MSSIGVVETLEYLDGKLSKQELEDKISLNTSKLAKDKIPSTNRNLQRKHQT